MSGQIQELQKQVKKARRSRKLTTKQLSDLDELLRRITMFKIIRLGFDEMRLRTLRDQQEYQKIMRVLQRQQENVSWKEDKPSKLAHVQEESSLGNNSKAFQRSYGMPPVNHGP